ncbi:hypothetical protein HYH03_017716 [Edaphochlamys debaryana]|uniref:Protein kinase domain-containing protein n=1 Tax=Edaphochlamys debaryana TaxID=47281 RepID=A0A835XG25_9CHLO|nr:hypothetical protein HYH03_017716 [Edaphochlamys debaryana]|eukprot:KAG2483408.1 hypothetical protein HYH03_017716 [Edaphochlamys debaryana]
MVPNAFVRTLSRVVCLYGLVHGTATKKVFRAGFDAAGPGAESCVVVALRLELTGPADLDKPLADSSPNLVKRLAAATAPLAEACDVMAACGLNQADAGPALLDARQTIQDALHGIIAQATNNDQRISVQLSEWCDGGDLHLYLHRLREHARRTRRSAPIGYVVHYICSPSGAGAPTSPGAVERCMASAEDLLADPAPPASLVNTSQLDLLNSWGGVAYGKDSTPYAYSKPPWVDKAVAQVAAVQAALDVARGVAALHAAGVTHGRLEPRTVLCASNPSVELPELSLSLREHAGSMGGDEPKPETPIMRTPRGSGLLPLMLADELGRRLSTAVVCARLMLECRLDDRSGGRSASGVPGELASAAQRPAPRSPALASGPPTWGPPATRSVNGIVPAASPRGPSARPTHPIGFVPTARGRSGLGAGSSGASSLPSGQVAGSAGPFAATSLPIEPGRPRRDPRDPSAASQVSTGGARATGDDATSHCGTASQCGTAEHDRSCSIRFSARTASSLPMHSASVSGCVEPSTLGHVSASACASASAAVASAPGMGAAGAGAEPSGRRSCAGALAHRLYTLKLLPPPLQRGPGGSQAHEAGGAGADLSQNTAQWRALAYAAPEAVAQFVASGAQNGGVREDGGTLGEEVAPAVSPVGPAADVYSLGALLWQLVSGGRPPHYERHPAQILMGLLSGDLDLALEWPEDVDPELAELGRACMRREPDSRPSAQEVESSLAGVLNRLAGALERGKPF